VLLGNLEQGMFKRDLTIFMELYQGFRHPCHLARLAN